MVSKYKIFEKFFINKKFSKNDYTKGNLSQNLKLDTKLEIISVYKLKQYHNDS